MSIPTAPIANGATKRFVVMLMNGDCQTQLIGSPDGNGFKSAAVARHWAKKYEDSYPSLQALVLPIDALGIVNVPLGRPTVRARERRSA